MSLFSRPRIYLDWASAAPVRPEALQAFIEAEKLGGNPGSAHAHGVRAKTLLEDARTTIAREAAVKPEGVIFTSGATEANNLFIHGYLRTKPNSHVLYLASAHSSTVKVVEEMGKKGMQIEELPLIEGRIDINTLKKSIRPETVLVVMEAVCGETGTQFDTREVRRVLDAARKEGERIILHVDASQLPLTGSFEHTHLGADSIVLDAQKIGGVRGIGALILPKKLSIQPLVYGGGQQGGIRPGTETPALATAFATALMLAKKERDSFIKQAAAMRVSAIEQVSKAIPDAAVNGVVQVPHIINFSFPGRDTDYLLMLMDTDGFSVATKSACETDAEGSRAVLALSGEQVRADSTIRISWGPMTKKSELEAGLSSLIRNIQFIDGTGT